MWADSDSGSCLPKHVTVYSGVLASHSKWRKRIIPMPEGAVAVECKWRAEEFSDRNLRIFSQHHEPEFCYVVCQDVDAPYQKKFGNLTVRFTRFGDLIRRLRELPL